MELYGILGNPLGHSFSPAYFAQKFKSLGIDADYVKFELASADEILSVIKDHPDLRGINVTIPYKQDVIPLLNDIAPEARAIGAVNCIRITRDVRTGEPHLKGYNADVIGFINSIRPLLKPFHKQALILGTGGASKAVVYGLQHLGIATQYVSRSKREGVLTYSDITLDVLQRYRLIVNCTPCGMSPHIDECPDLPYEALDGEHLLFDLIYNPKETLFLQKGREKGAVTKNGLDMLYGQAEASWTFWHEQE